MTNRSTRLPARAARVATLLFLAATFVALAFTVTAKPISTTASVPERIQAQRDMCETIGGGKMSVSVNTTTATATTTCKGGTDDGYTCVNTPSYTDCSKARTNPNTGVQADRPELAESGEQIITPAGPDVAALYDPRATYGETIDPRARLVIALCRDLGGGETVSVSAGPDDAIRIDTVACEGGVVDSLGCVLPEVAWCGLGFETLPAIDDPVPPGATVLPGGVPLVALPVAENAASNPGVIEQPDAGGEIVVYSQHGATVDERASGQIAACTFLGGTVQINHDVEYGFVDVTCIGGLLDGMYCTNGEITACIREHASMPETTVVTPIPVVQQPAGEAPTQQPAAEPTAAPTEPAPTPTVPAPEPTAAPTETPSEPTVAPPPTIPTNDNTIPPGEVEDPGPTPTPFILL